MYRTSEIAKKIGKTCASIYYRAEALGIKHEHNNGLLLWTDEQCDMIENYTQRRATKDKYSKIKINVVDFYLTHSYNTQVEIADKMGLSPSRVKIILDEFLETKHIIVDSKINN